MTAIDARALANGRWKGLLPGLGVSPTFLTGKQVACPCCGGKDRFRFDDRGGDGRWICNRCGSGDGYQLAERVLGVPFKEIVRRIRGMVGDIEREAPRRAVAAEEIKRALNGAWKAAEPLAENHPVHAYLKRRTGLSTFPPHLRQHDGLPSGEGLFPALLARITGPDGKPATLHRTFVTREGDKAPIAAPRKLMPGPVAKGAAIRLSDVRDVLGIAEGIETALSATVLHAIPCWAAIDAGRLMEWVKPEGCTRVVIFGDNDASFTGQMAAYTLARRLRTDGVAVEVRLPPAEGTDWNDVLRAQ